jgi:hypothetical protein
MTIYPAEMTAEMAISSAELWYLLERHASAVIIGFSDPTVGLTANDCDEVRRKAEQSLIERGVSRVTSSGDLVILPTIATSIGVLARPIHSLLAVVRSEVESPQVMSLHRGIHDLISLRCTEPDSWSLASHRDGQTVIDFLTGPILPLIHIEQELHTFELTKTTVSILHELASSAQAGESQQLLVHAGLTEDTATRLWPAFAAPLANLSLVTFLNRDKPERAETRGLSVLATADDLWLLQLAGQASDQVQFTRSSNTALTESILRLLAPFELAS